MSGGTNDDEYIAELLVQDARHATKKYELVGIDAFNSKRPKSGAPKPNTNFLRHIIRQTDSHNAALLAKESEESSARLKEMNREKLRAQRNERLRDSRKAEGRLTPVLSEEERPHSTARRRHTDDSGYEDRHNPRRRRRDGSVEPHTKRHRSRSRDPRREKRRRESSNDRASQHSNHHRRRNNRDDEEDATRRTHRSSRRHKRHRSRSRSPTTSPSRERNHKVPRRSKSPHHTTAQHNSVTRKSSNKSRQRSPSPDDSDPLEALVGPLPPNVQPPIRSRGRGAHKASSMGMDSRFSSTYDPTLDVRAASDAEDEWGDALEAFRDRQRFKQQGADRLRAAGFTDDQVKRLEKGDNKDEEDVTWSKGGQREWDRGKVVDEDGDIELKADWGRLK
ncbi:hypothetical protein DE146DRAFT_787245 [Phaeosphaeria sp. MPI-PUGE-AT-0046c]|nr:hypothetical protein DE146DRAFT_787245 [Phaeosphaeria sp. MPI-PUGE-AT-0046c]